MGCTDALTRADERTKQQQRNSSLGLEAGAARVDCGEVAHRGAERAQRRLASGGVERHHGHARLLAGRDAAGGRGPAQRSAGLGEFQDLGLGMARRGLPRADWWAPKGEGR